MKEKKLSIIVPHYNSFTTLQTLIESIPEREDIQIIVVDDNSTEGFEELVEYAKIKEFELFRNDSSFHSAGRCRNIGVSRAKGKWLLFADADDYFVENAWDIIDSHMEDANELIFFPPTSKDLSTGALASRHVKLAKYVENYCNTKSKETEVYLRYLSDVPYSKLISRELVEQNQILFDETRVANDVMFSARVACNAKIIAADNRVIYCITQSAGTLMTSRTRKDMRTRVKVGVNKYCYLRRYAEKDAFRILDFRIDYYMSFVRRYKGEKRDYAWTYVYCLLHGVRPFLSRKWTLQYAMSKIKGER